MFSLFHPRRWCNQLNPLVKRGPFTEEEDKKILAAHAVYGNKWAVISRGIPGRYGGDARAPRHTPRRRLNTLGTAKRLARFPAALSSRDAEPSFWRSRHPPRATVARFCGPQLAGSSGSRSRENLGGFLVSLFCDFFLFGVGRKGEVGHFAPPIMDDGFRDALFFSSRDRSRDGAPD